MICQRRAASRIEPVLSTHSDKHKLCDEASKQRLENS